MEQKQKTEPLARLRKRFGRLKEARREWEPVWRDCYAHALPLRSGFATTAARTADPLFDGTAPDAVDQLAASLLAELTPPWSRWFNLTAGADLPPDEAAAAGPVLEDIGAALQGHFDRSNFLVEMHQCYLDLVTGGTAALLFEESAPGGASAFRFRALPLPEVWLDEGETGRLETVFRRTALPLENFVRRFPDAPLTPDEAQARTRGDDRRIAVVEATRREDGTVRYTAFREEPAEARSADTGAADAGSAAGTATATATGAAGRDIAEKPLAAGAFADHPVIAFRWMKAPGEAWGRSPVMKALPDIRTANKVVELVLKNASIAVTGMWQADDDGVINPANIKLSPGVVIPKAVGSEGLKPLGAPGRFDVSELVLNDLRQRIRRALLVDKLGQADSPKMTATEVLERKAEMARLLGATFGRLQSELLAPLIDRGLAILSRRREIPPVRIDGRTIALSYASPLAREQMHRDIETVAGWAELVARLGPAGLAAVDAPRAARWAGRALGVPSALITPEPDAALAAPASATGAAAAPAPGPQAPGPQANADAGAALLQSLSALGAAAGGGSA
ncbi:MAG: portal protein [Rhodospirillaceae bacterium]|nr:portal protein [Rhodospirillaceae bacterium]